MFCAYTYNEHGDCIREECCCSLDEVMNYDEEGTIYMFEYEYEDNGYKISKKAYIDGTLDYIITYINKYDDFDNPLEIQYFENNNLSPYQIDYFEYVYY